MHIMLNSWRREFWKDRNRTFHLRIRNPGTGFPKLWSVITAQGSVTDDMTKRVKHTRCEAPLLSQVLPQWFVTKIGEDGVPQT